MRAAVLISVKDLKARLRDRSALLIAIVVPLGLAFIFNAIFSGMSGKAISLGVVNADRGAFAQQFISQVLGPVGRSGLIAVHIPHIHVRRTVTIPAANRPRQR